MRHPLYLRRLRRPLPFCTPTPEVMFLYRCDHTKLVWGPELECNDDTDAFRYVADLCNGPW